MGSFEPPGYCPNCGEYVEAGAKACPVCGSCAETGWNDEADYAGLDLPSGYDEEASAGDGASAGSGGLAKLGGVILLALLAYWLLRR